MCGITGIISSNKEKNIIIDLYDSLFHIQHRGQDSFGIATYNETLQKYNCLKKQGLLANNVSIRKDDLQGNMGIGHVRYPTSGLITDDEIQPFFVNRPYGLSISHNGHIKNKDDICLLLKERYNVYVNTTSDSEIILHLFAIYLENKVNKWPLSNEIIYDTIRELSDVLQGSYSIVLMIFGFGLVSFKDPYGIRPLVYGVRDDISLVSSESISLDNLDIPFEDVNSGEVIIMRTEGTIHKHRYKEYPLTPCIFEWIYISRIESVIHGISVYKARYLMGVLLAERFKSELISSEYVNIDCIVPVPETSKPCALAISETLNIPYREAVIKNRYVNRTFIMDTNHQRNKNIKRKLNVIRSQVEGKDILLIDDSIVRGNTMKHIVSLLKKNGVSKIYIISCSPMIKYPNYYGIDVSTETELIASNKSISDIEKELGVEKVMYQNVDDLLILFRGLNEGIMNYETSLFDGNYIV